MAFNLGVYTAHQATDSVQSTAFHPGDVVLVDSPESPRHGWIGVVDVVKYRSGSGLRLSLRAGPWISVQFSAAGRGSMLTRPEDLVLLEAYVPLLGPAVFRLTDDLGVEVVA